MPNFEAHAIAGTSVAFTWDQLRVEQNGEKYLLGIVIGGFVGGIAPEKLEPPIDPNHRGIFHSAGSGIGITWLNNLLANEIKNNEFWKGFLEGIAIGFICHLLMDSSTPEGIRLI